MHGDALLLDLQAFDPTTNHMPDAVALKRRFRGHGTQTVGSDVETVMGSDALS